ncbi:5'-nucleotidase, lipoprotein e(P4) family [Candidatus Cloacimonadota bacterium]
MKKMILIAILLSTLLILYSQDESQITATELNHEALLYAVLWHQTAAEYHALTYQAYNLARLRLDEDIAKNESNPKAVIVDIDETVLNNSAFNAREIMGLTSYSEGFYNWIAEAQGTAIPGALEFLNYADEKGYEIFYISNRSTKGLEGTIKNLLKFEFPQADSLHVLLKEDKISKEVRRNWIAADYEIVLLIGDNLIDFLEVFEHRSVVERYEAVENNKAEFGNKFIVLPNPMHGEWLKTLYDFDRSISNQEKMRRILRYLRTE